MSSHREAPEISKDPVADGTDVYAFVSPDRPDTVTLIANFIPLQKPDGGPNFYEFGDDVLYEIHVANRGTGRAGHDLPVPVPHQDPEQEDVPLQHRADQRHRGPDLEPAAVLQRDQGPERQEKVIARNLPCRRSTWASAARPDYAALSQQAVHSIGSGRKVFAGQRADAFHVDLGSIFDLGALRPFNEAHLISMPNMNGVNAVQSFNVHTIAIQVPISELARNGGAPTNPSGARVP